MDSVTFGRRIIDLFGKKAVEDVSERIMKLNEKAGQTKKQAVDYTKFEKLQKDIEEIEEEASTKAKQANEWQRAAFHDHGKDIEIYEKSNAQKLEAMQKFKELGNREIQNQDFQKASYYYAQALLYHVYLIPETEEETKKAKELEIKCRLNQALAFQKQDRHNDALNQLAMVLRLDPRNVKAQYRQASSLMELDRLEDARDGLKKARALHPDDPYLYEQMNKVKGLLEERKEKNLKAEEEFGQSLHYQPKKQMRVVNEEEGEVPISKPEVEAKDEIQAEGVKKIERSSKSGMIALSAAVILMIGLLVGWGGFI